MKNLTKIAFIVFIGMNLYSCNNEKKIDVDVVEEVTEMGLPNESDIHFDAVITALEENNSAKTTEELKKGTKALLNEVNGLTGKNLKTRTMN